ncbi:MAG: N-acetylmuramoyl-L-alanine amidase [Deltaproteobacteria bacterium]|nr:N-acetylmuramoyl-L-alanine amidase [Deltaproteobacteria bacterium]
MVYPERLTPRLGVLLLALVWAWLWVAPAVAQDQVAIYKRAKTDYYWLVKQPKARQVYSNWQSLADRFARVYTADPNGSLAAGSLLWTGRIHAGAYKQFKQKNDFYEAQDLLKRLINHFPRSRLADDAQMMIAELYEADGDEQKAYLGYLRVTVNYPTGDQVGEAKHRLDQLEKKLVNLPPREQGEVAAEMASAAPAPEESPAAARRPRHDPTLATLTELRHWSTKNYTRVVVNLERPVPYTANLLRGDQKNDLPRRIYLDLRGAAMGPDLKETQPIKGGLLMQARAGQFTTDTVRVVLDIEKLGSYKVFTLDNPFRVVIDCFAAPPKAERPALASKRASGKSKVTKVPRGKAQQIPPDVSLAAALGLGIRTVVIDPGHGGKDPGCLVRGLQEKHVTLDIAKRVARLLQQKLKMKVLLTRKGDTFVPLEARTAFANTNEADLFLSIHVNAAPSSQLRGIETYFLNLASDKQSMMVAARENATSTRTIGDLQVILNDLMLNSKINESNRLARALHGEVLDSLRQKYQVRDLKVRQAPFYVLIGAQMPAVLVEVGFITNPEERQRLESGTYRDRVAAGIVDGVSEYARQLKQVAGN